MTEVLDLQKETKENIKPELSKELGNLNIHAVPSLEKIVLNAGVGNIVTARKQTASTQTDDEELVKDIIEGLSLIGGQKPHPIRSSKSIAGFKLRRGMLVGLRATLRDKRMYDFLARVIHITLPRTRDFRGISYKSVDNKGNLNIGFRDSSVFPETPPYNFTWGLEATLVTDTESREEAIELFKKLNIPFEKD